MIFKNGFTIKIAQDRCLNQRHYMVACNHCVTNCPSDAIFIRETQVYLLKDDCSGCGLCLSDCPTQVFFSNQWDENNIIKNVEYHSWKTTEFFCGMQQTQYKRSDQDDVGAVQIPACLSSISKGAWFRLGLSTDLEINLNQCEDCLMKPSLSHLERNLSVAADWLESAGHFPVISYITESYKQRKKKSLKAVQVGVKATKRRDFFLSLAEFAKDAASGTYVKLSRKLLMEDCTPEWQKQFSQIYPECCVEGGSPTYWPMIEVDEQCVSCGVCGDFCPSKALEIELDEDTWTMKFTSGKCLDCRICQMICPVHAIERDRVVVPAPFDQKEVLLFDVHACKRCGDFVKENQGEYCHWCEKELAQENDLNQLCKNLFLPSRKSIED